MGLDSEVHVLSDLFSPGFAQMVSSNFKLSHDSFYTKYMLPMHKTAMVTTGLFSQTRDSLVAERMS